MWIELKCHGSSQDGVTHNTRNWVRGFALNLENFQIELDFFIFYTYYLLESSRVDSSTRFAPNIDGAHMIYGLASYVSLRCQDKSWPSLMNTSTTELGSSVAITDDGQKAKNSREI